MRLVPRLWLIAVVCSAGALGFAGRWLIVESRAAIEEETEAVLTTVSALVGMRLELAPDAPLTSWRRALDALRGIRHVTVSVTSPGRYLAPPEPGAPTVPGVPAWFTELVVPPGSALERRLPIGASGDEIIVRARPAVEVTAAWRRFAAVVGAGLAGALGALLWVALDLRGVVSRMGELARAIDGFGIGRHDVRIAPSGRPEVDELAVSFNRLADKLARSEAELSALAKRSLAIREDERRHLAHELHDGIGQSVSAIKALAVSIARKAKPDDGIAPSAQMIADVSSGMYDLVRRMMDRLRPSILDELGLVSALGSVIDAWNAHHEQTFCAFEPAGTIPDLSPDTGINVFRIVQEALTNVAKHAEASRVTVRLSVVQPPAALRLEIEDDGRGFDVAAARRGLGLVGIEERVRAVGGALRLATAPGQGTRFEVSIPLVRKEPHEHAELEAAHPAG